MAKRGVELGAGEIVLNSMDADGTKNGYDIELTTVAEDGGHDIQLLHDLIGMENFLLGRVEENHRDGVAVLLIVHGRGSVEVGMVCCDDEQGVLIPFCL